jgi:GT2 family glycosyltransferase
MPELSVVIINFNAKQYLHNCISSVISELNSHVDHEVIVVDDASTDGSPQMVKEDYSSVKLIENERNLGFVASNNIGIKAASGKFIFCLNNDTVVKDGAIKGLVNFMKAHPDAGAIGPKLLNSDGTIQYQCRRSFPTPLNSFFYFSGISRFFPKSKTISSYLMTYLDDAETIKVDSLCGAAMMVTRDVVASVGPMDEDYFMYGDDIDWCYRIKKAGWNIYYHPQAEIFHYGGRGGSRSMPFKSLYRYYRAMAVYHKKHNAGRHFFILNCLVYTAIWMKFTISVFASIIRKDKYVGTKKP